MKLKHLFLSWHYAGIAALTLGLAACSTTPVSGSLNSAESTSAVQRQYAKQIITTGRLSIFYDKNGSKQAAHGSFTWQQSPQVTHVTLYSPLGQTIAIITLTPDEATLQQADRDPVQADDADMLTETILGWPLPIKGLKDWLQGFGENSQHQPFIAQPNNQDAIVTDSGWQLNYLRWGKNDQSQWYPERINLDRHSEQAGDIAIRIVVDSAQTK